MTPVLLASVELPARHVPAAVAGPLLVGGETTGLWHSHVRLISRNFIFCLEFVKFYSELQSEKETLLAEKYVERNWIYFPSYIRLKKK